MDKHLIYKFSNIIDTILYYYDSVSTMIEYTEVREDIARFKGSYNIDKEHKRVITIELEITNEGKIEISKHEEIFAGDKLKDESWAVLNLKNKDSILDFMHENFFIPLRLINMNDDNSTEEDLTGVNYVSYLHK